ncbi:MAG TPA: aminomethyl-transferring glycine dehydrogenase subunit GcvPB, partial [Alphaproteobacteria bacterium]|nr:aminomethyl-transferring glycine dehydrogenase subunit GcvPB [Alphaproteobacteria bacterium]
MNRQGRPTAAIGGASEHELSTFSGHRGLDHEEPLLFEIGRDDHCGVDFPEVQVSDTHLGGLRRQGPVGLPGLSEPEVVRHFVRLSRKNYAIDTGLYPLGSCTMKHNPRLNEKMARLPGFAHVHPLQPVSTVQGALALIDELSHWLKVLTGMPAVAMSPKAGAHGELCGLLAIRAAHEAKGDTARKRVLVPESAHGTNPATAALVGFTVDEVPANDRGRVDLAALKAKLGPDTAAIMLTNPNTCGLFENDIREIAAAVHAAGAYFYCDGANFNAIVGRVRPGDLGIDAMHINLHKTFSTPHGGGGPGSGPVVLSEALAAFAPLPVIRHDTDGFHIVESERDARARGLSPFGRMTAFHGQMGMFVRALSYMLSHGADGLWQAAGDAVLNANYVLASLKDVMTAPFEGPCMHEALFDDRFLKDTGVSTLDFAKAMIDEGYHPMTMYFPLVVHGAMLIEPTETESKEALDQFINVMRNLA